MGDSLRDQVWLPLLIGLASQVVVTALYFLSVRLWKCFLQKLTPRIAGGESMTDHEPDLEIATLNGGEGGESMTDHEPDLEIATLNGGEGGESMTDHEPDLEIATLNGGEDVDDRSGERARPDQDVNTLTDE